MQITIIDIVFASTLGVFGALCIVACFSSLSDLGKTICRRFWPAKTKISNAKLISYEYALKILGNRNPVIEVDGKLHRVQFVGVSSNNTHVYDSLPLIDSEYHVAFFAGECLLCVTSEDDARLKKSFSYTAIFGEAYADKLKDKPEVVERLKRSGHLAPDFNISSEVKDSGAAGLGLSNVDDV